MRFRRSDRPAGPDPTRRSLDAARAERLLDDAVRHPVIDPTDPLGRLLAAAAAPPNRAELAGEEAAVAAFRAARAQRPVAAPAPVRQRRRPGIGPAAWVAGLAAAATAGVSFAAVSLNRPDSPAPPATTSPATTPGQPSGSSGAPGGSSTGAGPTGSTPTPGASAGTTTGATRPGRTPAAGGNAGVAGLCRAYLDTPAAERARALRRPAFRALIEAAGGADRVDQHCRQDDAADPDPTRTPPEQRVEPDARVTGKPDSVPGR